MRLFILPVFFFCAVTAFSQRILNPNAVFSDNKVIVRFSIAEGDPCAGFEIYHTADSTQPFQWVGGSTEICGSFNTVEAKSATHENPALNQMNFYQVRLQGEISPIIRVFGGGSQPGLFIFPNPAGGNDEYLNLRVLNTERTRLVGFLYNRFGTVIAEPDIVANEGRTTFGLNGLERGVYVLWLTDGSNVFSGKFIVTR